MDYSLETRSGGEWLYGKDNNAEINWIHECASDFNQTGCFRYRDFRRKIAVRCGSEFECNRISGSLQLFEHQSKGDLDYGDLVNRCLNIDVWRTIL